MSKSLDLNEEFDRHQGHTGKVSVPYLCSAYSVVLYVLWECPAYIRR